MSKDSKATHATLHATTRNALGQAQRQGTWVVIICPEESLAQCQQALIGVLPEGTTFSGRTVLLKNGGKLSVTAAETPVFIPEGMPFTALFTGGGGTKDTSRGMALWRKRSTAVLDNRTLLGLP